MSGEWNPMSQSFVSAAPTLAEFLLARIDEDAEVAWRAPDVYACWNGSETDQDLSSVADIAPGRLLAECEAKRRIVELHPRHLYLPGSSIQDMEAYCETCVNLDDEGDPCITVGEIGYPCDTLRVLALPYASHPDYRSEWAP